MFMKDFLYICLSWPAALEHGKIEENFSRVWGDKGIEAFLDARALKTLQKPVFWTDFMLKNV